MLNKVMLDRIIYQENIIFQLLSKDEQNDLLCPNNGTDNKYTAFKIKTDISTQSLSIFAIV